MYKNKVVILYGKEKHEIFAEGLKKYLEGSKLYDVACIDDESFTPSYSASFKRKFYRFSNRNATWMYKLYSIFDEKKSLRLYGKQRKGKGDPYEKSARIKRMVAYVKNIMLRFDPIAVICMTHKALKLALIVRDMNQFEAKIMAYIPDFGVDLRFLDLRCDYYLVGNDYVKERLIHNEIESDRIFVSGIPYASSHKIEKNKYECKKQLNIDNDYPIVILSGGKYGALTIIDDYSKILDSICQFNLIVLTGGNKKLITVMKAIKDSESKNVQFIDSSDYSTLLTAADIFITLPTTENILNGMVYDCAVVTTNPISKIEKDNFYYLSMSGIAKSAKNAINSQFIVTELLLEDSERQKVIKAAKEYMKNNIDIETKGLLKLMEADNVKTHSDVQAE